MSRGITVAPVAAPRARGRSEAKYPFIGGRCEVETGKGGGWGGGLNTPTPSGKTQQVFRTAVEGGRPDTLSSDTVWPTSSGGGTLVGQVAIPPEA